MDRTECRRKLRKLLWENVNYYEIRFEHIDDLVSDVVSFIDSEFGLEKDE